MHTLCVMMNYVFMYFFFVLLYIQDFFLQSVFQILWPELIPERHD